MLMEQINNMLEQGYQELETGYCKLENGQLYVTVLTRMPRCKGEMVDWWFGYVGDTEKYKLWHPHDHVSGHWDEHWKPGCYIGASHISKEYMKGEVRTGRARFFEPGKFFDTSRFSEANVGVVVCAEALDYQGKERVAYLFHLVRDTEYGCEMRSRFWIFNAPEEKGAQIMQHCIEEMGYLADLLPDLYAKENTKE